MTMVAPYFRWCVKIEALIKRQAAIAGYVLFVICKLIIGKWKLSQLPAAMEQKRATSSWLVIKVISQF